MTESVAEGVPAPRENARLEGQEAAERRLLSAWTSGRLPHAWLLSGARGVGKATLAFRFARFVLSGGGDGGLFGQDPDDLHLPPDSEVFRRVAAAGHADLMTVERAVDEKTGRLRKEIVVGNVRKVGDFLHLTAGEGAGGWSSSTAPKT